VRELLEPVAAESEDLGPLATHVRHQHVRAAAAGEPRQRREVEVGPYSRLVGDGPNEREGTEEPVQAGREDGRSPGAVAVELAREPAPDPLQVGLRSLARPA